MLWGVRLTEEMAKANPTERASAVAHSLKAEVDGEHLVKDGRVIGQLFCRGLFVSLDEEVTAPETTFVPAA